jgi:hypothetical protein
VDVADDAEGSGGDEDADEVQLDERNPTVVTASSISSCTRVEGDWSGDGLRVLTLSSIYCRRSLKEGSGVCVGSRQRG